MQSLLQPSRFANISGNVDESPQMCPSGPNGPWFPWSRHTWVDTYLSKVAAQQVGTPPKSLADFWKRRLQASLGPLPGPHVLFAQGAIFSVSAAQIRAHPKAF